MGSFLRGIRHWKVDQADIVYKLLEGGISSEFSFLNTGDQHLVTVKEVLQFWMSLQLNCKTLAPSKTGPVSVLGDSGSIMLHVGEEHVGLLQVKVICLHISCGTTGHRQCSKEKSIQMLHVSQIRSRDASQGLILMRSSKEWRCKKRLPESLGRYVTYFRRCSSLGTFLRLYSHALWLFHLL